MEASITLKKVGKLIDRKTILASLTFGIEKGSLVAIIGDNEAGKSMLLKVISGVEYQEYGQVFINGLDSKKRRSESMLSIGFVPHELDLDPWLTLEENIRFMGMLYGVNTEIFLIFNFFKAVIAAVLGVVTFASGFANFIFLSIESCPAAMVPEVHP